jgi:hypothetical protein
LNIINQLEVKTYEYNSEYIGSGLNLPAGKQYGFIAQDVESVLPEAVMNTQLPVPPTAEEMKQNRDAKETYIDAKVFNPGPLLPISIQAIKEQQQQIEDLKQQMEEMKKQMQEQQKVIDQLLNNTTNGPK